MAAWIVKGKPSRNDLSEMLAPGRKERWVTRKPPRDWAAGDQVFMWKGAPALCVLGAATIESVRRPDANGDSFFVLRYATGPLKHPIGIAQLRDDPAFAGASFLKAGAAGTLFALTPKQASRLESLIRKANKVTPSQTEPLAARNAPSPKKTASKRPDATEEPELALSIRQPWAELIMRSVKTIEVRTTVTHKRTRVHIYAGNKRAHAADEERVARQYRLDVDALPRGVLVGTVEIVDCRPVSPDDSALACFVIEPGDTSFGWHLSAPIRAKMLREPTGQPQPMFFRPF